MQYKMNKDNTVGYFILSSFNFSKMGELVNLGG